MEVVDGLDGQAVGAWGQVFQVDGHACGDDWIAFSDEIVEGLDSGEG